MTGKSMISLDCECGRSFQVADSLAGRTVRCPKCGDEWTAPILVRVRTKDDEEKEKRHKDEGIFFLIYAGFIALGCLFKLALLFVATCVVAYFLWSFLT